MVGSAKRFNGRGVEDVVRSAKKNAKPEECQQGGRKTCLHGLYFRLAFRCNKVVD